MDNFYTPPTWRHKTMKDSHTTRYLSLAAILFFAASAPLHADNSEEARAGIEATSAKWMTAFNSGDAAGVAALYTEDSKILPPSSKVRSGRAEIQDTFQGYIDAGIKIKLVALEVEGHGDTAIEVGIATLTGADGQTIDEDSYIVIWKLVGGEWQFHRDIWNSNTPPPQPEESESGGDE